MESAALMKRASSGIALLILLASPAFAGPLNGDGTAIPFYTGTTAFANASGLTGTVDYAVYTYAAFQAEWGGLGYNPPVGQDVYTYQVILNSPPAGTLGVSHLSVHIENPANTPGSFLIAGGQAPSTVNIGGGGPPSADYFFAPTEIPPGSTSFGLAFSSPNSPMMRFGSLVDGGTTAFVIPLPTPSPNLIPEPATISLLFAAALCGVPVAFRRLRRR